MKRDAYERAKEIETRINYLEDLINLLCNAANNTPRAHRLAAIRKTNDYETTLEIANELGLDPDIKDMFIRILNDEIKQLRDEFDKL